LYESDKRARWRAGRAGTAAALWAAQRNLSPSSLPAAHRLRSLIDLMSGLRKKDPIHRPRTIHPECTCSVPDCSQLSPPYRALIILVALSSSASSGLAAGLAPTLLLPPFIDITREWAVRDGASRGLGCPGSGADGSLLQQRGAGGGRCVTWGHMQLPAPLPRRRWRRWYRRRSPCLSPLSCLTVAPGRMFHLGSVSELGFGV
jgi:hypothetical protein